VVVVRGVAGHELAQVEVDRLGHAPAATSVGVPHIAEQVADHRRDAGLLTDLARGGLLRRLVGVAPALRQPQHAAAAARRDDHHLAVADDDTAV
jgi:hypothetical protein